MEHRRRDRRGRAHHHRVDARPSKSEWSHTWLHDGMNFGVGLPNVGEFADPVLLVELAVAAEAAGWDGFFVWDHLLYDDARPGAVEPWSVIAAGRGCNASHADRRARHRGSAAAARVVGATGRDGRFAVAAVAACSGRAWARGLTNTRSSGRTRRWPSAADDSTRPSKSSHRCGHRGRSPRGGVLHRE